MLNITSDSNKHIKKMKQLSKKKYRQKYETFIVEGTRIVEQMLEKVELIEAIFVSEDTVENQRVSSIIESAMKNNISVFSLEPKLFKSVALTDSTQGIMAEINMPKYDLQQILCKGKLRLVIIDKVQDPGNMGTIIRTADAANFDGILVLKGSVDRYNDKTLRSTMGSIISIPIVDMDDIGELIDVMKDNEIQVIATDLNTDKYHFDVDYNIKSAVVVGNEGNGVDKSLLDISDIRVKIPMIGSAESLNVSVASGIVIYEIVKQDIIQKI